MVKEVYPCGERKSESKREEGGRLRNPKGNGRGRVRPPCGEQNKKGKNGMTGGLCDRQLRDRERKVK